MASTEHRFGGLASWLLARLRPQARPRPSLTLLERITIAPRQSLALVEADGRRFLIATSADGAPAFHPLGGATAHRRRNPTTRISW